MKIANLMCRDVAACGPDDPMSAAARVMWEHDCGIVPVVDTGRHVLGVVTDRDLCMAAFTRDEPLSRLPLRLAMSKAVHACHPEDEEEAAHTIMRAHQVRRVPVVDADGRLAGLVSLNDLALAASSAKGEAAGRRQREVAKTLTEIGKHRVHASA